MDGNFRLLTFNNYFIFNKKSIIFILEFLISIISFFVAIFSKPVNGYEYMPLIPLFYSLFLLSFPSYSRLFGRNYGVSVIHIISFIKYVIMIMCIGILKDYYGGVLTSQIPPEKYIIEAVFLMIYEMFIVFVTIEIFTIFKRHRKQKNRLLDKRSIVFSKVNINCLKIIFAVISILLIIRYYYSFFPINFILNGSFETIKIDSNIDGAITILFFVIKVFFLCEGLNFCFKKFEKNNSYLYIILSFVFVAIYLFLMISHSRWNIIIPLIAYFVLSKQYFRNKAKIINISVIIIIVILVIRISLSKFDWIFKNSNFSLTNFISVMLSQMQEYFSGIRPIAQGLQTANEFSKQINLYTMINDFTGSIPLLSHFVDQTNRINYYFNILVKGYGYSATQIMPMITIGYAYFGYLFSGFFTFINLVCVLSFAEMLNKKSSVMVKFSLLTAVIWFAMCLGFNTQIIFGNFISSLLPVFVFGLLFEKMEISLK